MNNMGHFLKNQIVPTAPSDCEVVEDRASINLFCYLSETVARGDSKVVNAINDYMKKCQNNLPPTHLEACNCPCVFMTCLKSQEMCSEANSSSDNPHLCSPNIIQAAKSSSKESKGDVRVVKETELARNKQTAKHLKRKRIRTLTEESEQGSAEEVVNGTPQPDNRKTQTKRKVIKGASTVAWVVASPIMFGLNLLRGSNDNDDEDDKVDDPLRPWNYKVDYQRPHKKPQADKR